jgi:hypothetical protein
MSREYYPRARSIGAKFLLWFLVVALSSLVVVGVVAYQIAIEDLAESEKRSLAGIRDAKVAQIEAYVRERERDVTTSARNPTIVAALREFDAAFRQAGIDSPEYVAVDRRYRPFLQYYREAFGYSDLFLVSASGHVVFSVMRAEGLGSNCYEGPYRGTELARAADNAGNLLLTEMSDFVVPARITQGNRVEAPILVYFSKKSELAPGQFLCHREAYFGYICLRLTPQRFPEHSVNCIQ